MSSTSTLFRLRFAGLALAGLVAAGSVALAAPKATDVPAPSCAGGFVAVCKKPIWDMGPPPKITGCSEWQCEMPKTRYHQSVPVRPYGSSIRYAR